PLAAGAVGAAAAGVAPAAGVVTSSAVRSARGMSMLATGIFSLFRISISSETKRSLIREDCPKAIGVVSNTILSMRCWGMVLIFTFLILLMSLPPDLMPTATPSKLMGTSILIG